ncbi:BamA/TamA family outer membrane protein [Flaviaesturariibacter amylovorans]|uniref:POTRA domain-containing protein n=1 Tax=Flaviaesturariibacter amylovorans TaxID=1084520 RepID=A0ABP8HPY6_9BACT
MLTVNTHTRLLLLALFVLLGSLQGRAQTALAQETLLFSTKEVPSSGGDTTRIYTITDVEVTGARRTREKVLYRELPFETGEELPLYEIVARCTEARTRLMNTGLFLDVDVRVASTEDNDARVLVTVQERWYFFPVPFVDVVGMPYQQWVKEGMPLANVKYGIRIKHKNISGLNDKLTLNLTNGYQKEAQLIYEGLPLDNNLNWTFGFSLQRGQQHDVTYGTEYNKPVGFHDGDRFIYKYSRAQAFVTFRPAIKTRHIFGIGYHDERVADTIASLNKAYLFERNAVRYPEIFYQMQYLDLDFAPYPTRGMRAEVMVHKKGIKAPVNLWQLSARASRYFPVTAKSFVNVLATGLVKLPFRQPYPMQQFVGYNEMFLQGYEDYTIDGVAGGFVKASFHQRIVDRKVAGPRIKRLPQLRSVPVKIYAKAFANAGYIYNERPGTNFLNNRLLRSAGLGLDIVLFYDVTFRIEYSVNGNGQNGLYLHNKNRW